MFKPRNPLCWSKKVGGKAPDYGNVVNERLHVHGESEQANWTQSFPTTPFCYFGEEAVNMFSGNVLGISNADTAEVSGERIESLTEC